MPSVLGLLISFAVLNVAFLAWVFVRILRDLKTKRENGNARSERREPPTAASPLPPPKASGGFESGRRPASPLPADSPTGFSRPRPQPAPARPMEDTAFGDHLRVERERMMADAERALAQERRAEDERRRSEAAPRRQAEERAQREIGRESAPASPAQDPPTATVPAPTAAVPAPMDHDPSAPPFTEVPVFYGTNRGKADAGVWYGAERGEMRFGRCLVTVPTDRRIGTIPRPSLWTFFREKSDRHYILANVEEIAGKDAFSRGLREYVRKCAKRQALVFVHGFNVTFADAVYRTAQIASDLDFQGAPILFSWPSKGTLHPLGYTYDETQARWTLPDLRAFLELVAEQSGAEAIHLLAHSMGNRALTEALGQIAAATARRSRALFNELMLTAPDIDADTFVRDIAPAMLPASARVTLYASSNDRALAFSKTVHGYPRAGESGDGLVLIEGIDTIDVSAVDTNFVGHFYYGDNRSVLSDLFNLMQGQAAERRFGLRARQKNARPYWVFQP